MLPVFWGLLVHTGAIRLHQDGKPKLIHMGARALAETVIKPKQGGWDLDLALTNAEITKQFAANREDDRIKLDTLYEEWHRLVKKGAIRLEPIPSTS